MKSNKKSNKSEIPKIETNVKSVCIKIKNTDDKLNLFHIFKEYSDVCSQMYDDIMSYSGLILKDKDNNIAIDSSEVISKLSKKYEISPDVIISFFNEFANASKVKSYAALLCQDVVRTKYNDSTGIKLRNAGLFPLKYNNPNAKYNILGPSGGYKYSVIKSLYTKISSWIECNDATVKDYKQLMEKYEELNSKLLKKYPKEVLNDFINWINECEQYNFSLNRNHWKFISFFQNNLWQSLKNGSPKEFGEWTTTSGKNIEYSCNKTVIELLYNKYKSLWNCNNPLFLDSLFGEYLDVFNDVKQKHQHSAYTKISLYKNPVRLLLGNNYVSYKRNNGIEHDEKNHTLTFNISYPYILNNTNDDAINENKSLKLVASYKRKYKGNRFYFENLKVTPYETNNSGVYIFEYSINGKRYRKASLCEPSIRLVINNKSMDINNPKLSDFDFYIDLVLNVEINPSHNFESNDLWKLRAEFSSAYPNKSVNKRLKSIDNQSIRLSTNTPINIMSIDLGLRNPFAYSIFNFDKGEIKYITSGVYKDNIHIDKNNIQRIEYKKFTEACHNVQDIIKYTRYYLNGYRSTITSIPFTKLNKYLNEIIPNFIPYNVDDYIKWVDSKKNLPVLNSDNNVMELFKNKDNKWIVRQLTFQLKKQFSKLLNDRKQFNSFENHFSWIKCIETYIRMMKSYQKSGMNFRTNKRGITGQSFKKLKEKIVNIKLDYMKKLAFHIANIANQHKCCIVVTEKLENLRGNVYNDKDRNVLYNTWPVSQIKFYIENALADYNILLAEANERNTSQIYVDKKMVHWGYRNEHNLDELWWEDSNGNLAFTHADENAAKNLGMKYLSNHTNQYSIEMCPVNDKFYVPKSSLMNINNGTSSDGGGKKQEKGFLFKSFNTVAPVFELNNETLTYIPKKKVNLKKVNPNNKSTWYVVDDTYTTLINSKQRELILNKIKDKVESKTLNSK